MVNFVANNMAKVLEPIATENVCGHFVVHQPLIGNIYI